MAGEQSQIKNDVIQQDMMLRLLAEQLKQPLIYVARGAELQAMNSSLSAEDCEAFMRRVMAHADSALKLIDGYILGLGTMQQRLDLPLEPISLSALLYDLAHELTPVARQRNINLQLSFAGRYGQVMAHRSGLDAALFGVGSVLLDALGNNAGGKELHIAAHKSRTGIVAGLYSPGIEAMQQSAPIKQVRQPYAQLTSQPAAGMLIAETLIASMSSRLRIGQFRGERGWALTLQPSHQMRLV